MATFPGADDASSTKGAGIEANSQYKANKFDLDDLDLDYDPDEDKEDYKKWFSRESLPAIRSAFLIHLVESRFA